MLGTKTLSEAPISALAGATTYVPRDSTVTTATAGSVGSVTFSHNVNSALSNTILIVSVVLQRNGAAAVSTVSGITYNSVPMTRAVRENTYATSISTEIWYLVAPTTGANNVVVTLSSAVTSDIIVNARTYYNIDQSSPIVTTGTGSNFASSLSTSVTTVNTDDVIVDALYTYLPFSATYPQSTAFSAIANANSYGFGSDKLAKSIGSNSMAWSYSTTADLSQAVVVLKQAAGGSNTTVTPGTASLTLTAQIPTATKNTVLTPGTLSLTTTAQTPTATLNTILTPGTASLTITAQTPTVAATNNVAVTPGIATLTLTAQTPTVTATANVAVTPGIIALTTTNWTPTVAATNHVAVTPGIATLTIAAQTPTVAATNNVSVTPGVASLTLTAQSPDVTAGGNQSATPGTASLTLTAQTPTVALSDNKTATPDTASLTISAQTPTVVYNQIITPGVATLTITTFAPSLTVPTTTTVTPGIARLRIKTFAPIVNGQVPTRKYYIDEKGNFYWVVSESAGFVKNLTNRL